MQSLEHYESLQLKRRLGAEKKEEVRLMRAYEKGYDHLLQACEEVISDLHLQFRHSPIDDIQYFLQNFRLTATKGPNWEQQGEGPKTCVVAAEMRIASMVWIKEFQIDPVGYPPKSIRWIIGASEKPIRTLYQEVMAELDAELNKHIIPHEQE